MSASVGMEPYFAHGRSQLRRLLRGNGMRVLELGCASGVFGQGLLQAGIAEAVDGIEHDAVAADVARSRLSSVWWGDLNTFDFSTVPLGYDVVVAADVLEHLVDPWNVLETALGHLRSGGLVVVSLPNVRYYRVLYDLVVRGRFDYQPAGVLDRTHLRFFTQRSAIELLVDCGLRDVQAEYADPGRTGLKRFISHGFADLSSPQIYVSGVKP